MNRRRWLKRSAAATFGLVPWTVNSQNLVRRTSPATRIVDTHTHFYDPTRPGGVPWPPKDSPLHRKVMPSDWLKVAEPHGARETVVVEASPLVEDNQWILDLATQEKCIVGFIGNLDPRDARFGEHLKRFSANSIFRGVRWRADLVPVDAADKILVAAARALADRRLALDLNGPDMLQRGALLAAQVPELSIVIDHLGAPGDPRAIRKDWLPAVQTAAAHANIFMKVSALVEQVKGVKGDAPDDAAFYRPILDPLWDTFGPERLIYGSNWPVCERGGSYDRVFKIVKDYLDSKSFDEAENFFWKNSLLAYGWTGRG